MIQRLFLFASLAAACLPSALAQRAQQTLTTGWSFIRRDIGPALTPIDSLATSVVPKLAWETVTLPHTWNAIDAQNGTAADPKLLPDGYWRGAAWYVTAVNLPPEWKGRRIFVRFEGVATVADIYLNDTHLTQHRGAFAAFTVELTSVLKHDGPNWLHVRADNSRFADVAPLQGDFSIFGGIYRPVTLFATDPVCISPLEHGAPGVFLTTRKLTAAAAEVEVRTLVSNGQPQAVPVEVVTEITGEHGVVAKHVETVNVPAGGLFPVVQRLTIAQPRRWHGRRDPFLHGVTVQLRRGGAAVDAVSQTLGLRTFEISDARGPLLNGEPYPLHGVNRHQDRFGQGWAVSAQDHAEDIAMILELGCTTLRLAHYQQSETVHELCDRAGLVVWQEIPLVDRISSLPGFAENAREQLTEMILQGYNRPSLCMWGLFNELEATWGTPPGPRPDQLIVDLREHARTLDQSRPLVAASWMRHADPLHALPEAIAFNVYPGWYWGKPDDFGPMVDSISGHLGGRRIGISEYGAGGSVLHHDEGPLTTPKNTATRFHPEEWQTFFHERTWAAAKDHPKLWGTWIWNMYDFAIDVRDEGDTPGRNDKGLVTYDRKTRKDAFYFYQANWTTAPMAYLAERRLTPRKIATRDVKVFSNCPEVELFVNGKSLGAQKPDRVCIARWPAVTLSPGENKIEIVAKSGAETRRDACVWVLE